MTHDVNMRAVLRTLEDVNDQIDNIAHRIERMVEHLRDISTDVLKLQNSLEEPEEEERPQKKPQTVTKPVHVQTLKDAIKESVANEPKKSEDFPPMPEFLKRASK